MATAKSKSRASELIFRAALMLGSGDRLRQRSTCMHATRTVSVHECASLHARRTVIRIVAASRFHKAVLVDLDA
jgi:hypothetical protein